jgi:hypothetical protein
MTVNFAKLLGLLRRSPPISKACKVAAAHFTIQKERRSVDGFAGLGVSVKGSSLCIVDHAASSRPHSSVLQEDGFISKISVQLPPSPPTGIGPSCGPRWRFA